uniref:RUN and TBC1 domain-containing protein 3 n=1 Tax=Panagrolaimus sp. ES5 TaxID=591445 RepID=A0AC34FM49_9BILA
MIDVFLGTSAKFADSALEDDEIDSEIFETNEETLPVTTSIFNLNGKPFSAVHRQTLPKYFVEPQELFDEFGFRISSTKTDTNSESELETSQHRDSSASVDGQIEKDLLRTLPSNLCFAKADAPGIASLRKVLKTVAFMYPELGYCQGMGVVATTLLLVCGEEQTFWTMCALIEDILPPSFYSHSLLGVQADEKVVKHLMCIHTPKLVELIRTADVDMSMITINWLLTIFATAFPLKVVLRLWDFLFIEGGVTVFRFIMAMLKMREPDILLASQISDHSSAEIFNAIAQIPSTISDPNGLIDYSLTFEDSITPQIIASLRKKYQGQLMADSGMIFEAPTSDGNLPKQKMVKRHIPRSKSFLPNIFKNSEALILDDEDDENDPKTKNIRQTEMIVDLRNSIHQICRHFTLCNEDHEQQINMQADYSLESHDKDCEIFLRARREGRKRARALLDFQQQEEDELGFYKNDIINILSEKDEHCWVGELHGERGWFPAKFVEIIDERGKNYCAFGDEAVQPRIGEIVRGQFSQAFFKLLNHGLREANIIAASFVSHPWPFIEALSAAIVESKTKSVNSKLMLCDTFKLDQDGKVLSPEELLYRAVQDINQSHNGVGAQLDVKMRSLIAFALNEQCLHLWFEMLCASNHQNAIRERYYHSYAFVRSPAWKQV